MFSLLDVKVTGLLGMKEYAMVATSGTLQARKKWRARGTAFATPE